MHKNISLFKILELNIITISNAYMCFKYRQISRTIIRTSCKEACKIPVRKCIVNVKIDCNNSH